MALYGHISQTVGATIRFLTALMGNDLAIGMMLGNALMLLISICAFYGSVKVLLPGSHSLSVNPHEIGDRLRQALSMYGKCWNVYHIRGRIYGRTGSYSHTIY